MCFFLYIVYELLVGLSNATNQEASDPVSKGKNKDKDKDELAWQRLWGSSQPTRDPRGDLDW